MRVSECGVAYRLSDARVADGLILRSLRLILGKLTSQRTNATLNLENRNRMTNCRIEIEGSLHAETNCSATGSERERERLRRDWIFDFDFELELGLRTELFRDKVLRAVVR